MNRGRYICGHLVGVLGDRYDFAGKVGNQCRAPFAPFMGGGGRGGSFRYRLLRACTGAGVSTGGAISP